MAWGKNNKTVETISAEELLALQERVDTLSPEKLIIVAGPSFGTVVKFILLGAAIGAAGVTVLRDKNSSSSKTQDAIYEGVSGGGAKDKSTLDARADSVLRRAKGLASRARDAAQIVAEAARPTIEGAIEQGKAAANQTERDLKQELESEISKEEG